MTTKELLALVGAVRESLDGLLYGGKYANATDEDKVRDEAYYEVDPALRDLELCLPALCAEVEAQNERIAQQDATIARMREALANEVAPTAADWKRRQVAGWKTMEAIADMIAAALTQEQVK